MEKITLQEVTRAVGGVCNFNCAIEQISTDTRTITAGCMFIAIKGENFDGHDFIEKAFDAGAVAVISSRPVLGRENVVLVTDTSKALLDLAKFYKSRFSAFTVAVTGSVGKTSTKEMIYTILTVKGKTLKTKGNFNNEIGMPLTLLNMTHDTVNAVIEMGMSDFKEISVLTNVAKPNVGVITNIGVSHIETLKTRENILKAKLEILEGMEPDAPLILNGDDDLLATVDTMIDQPIIYFGTSENNCDITASDIVSDGEKTNFTINYYGKNIRATIPTVGKHNVLNALAGFCVGLVANIPPEQIVGAMKWYKNASMRQNTTEIKGITVIEDCYNASPDSMRAAIDVLTSLECKGRRFCVFGDMLELGEISEQAHVEVGKNVGRARVDFLFTYGDGGKQIKRGAMMVGMKNVMHFDNKDTLASHIANNITVGDVIIFKASRGVKLEQVIEKLKELIH